MKNKIKGKLHNKNPHKGQYNFKLLIKNLPELKTHIKKNPKGKDTIDFSNSKSVLLLNKALLKTYYDIENWSIPNGFLCPPIPGRADYIHYIAELVNKNKKINVLDIGTGANCIYPIIGVKSYNWNFVGTEIEKESFENAKKIVNSNGILKNKVKLKLQNNKDFIFKGILEKNDKFDITMCNPPFFSSKKEAISANLKKVKNLSKGNSSIKKGSNFGGKNNELWCKGGEKQFLLKMANESVKYSNQVTWFTSLVSNQNNIKSLKDYLNKLGVKVIKIFIMSQGQKISRIIAWKY